LKAWLIVLVGLVVVSAIATTVVYRRGWTLYYGDAEARLAIARRVIDSRTPGYDQIGTVWLPLPVALMLPLVGNDRLWENGLAGALPSSVGFVFAGLFLFGAVRRLFGSIPPAAAAVACFALNPNVLYLQATPMTEAVWFAGILGLLYFSVRFAEKPSVGFVFATALASLALSLTRYDGWFLIPFCFGFVLLNGGKRRIWLALFFGLVASLGALYWLAHNWWYFGNPLDFYNGPYSAKAIQGSAPYPGKDDWAKAWLYFRSAAALCAGLGAVFMAAIGLLAAIGKRAWWPLALLSLPPVFYIWSMHSSGNPIFIPTLWPRTYYNSRYGLAAWPLIAFCAGAAVLWAPRSAVGRTPWSASDPPVALGSTRGSAVLVGPTPSSARDPLVALGVVLVAIAPWLLNPHPESWVVWKESQVNSEARRAWTIQTADYLATHYRRGTGIFGTLGDPAGAYREAGIPFREVLQEGNEPEWEAAAQKPDLFLHEEWAVAFAGDRVAKAAQAAHYDLVKTIAVKGARTIEIYKRR
jgi:hypothetical protein